MSRRTVLVAAALSAYPLHAQQPSPRALASWVALDMPTGYETRFAPALAEAMPGWEADRWGNLVTRVGSGTPRRVVACALDAPAYAASQITEDGYLRVHRIGRGSDHPLWDQAFEAQQVRILTRDGPVAGVVARSNGHFARQHRDERTPVTADDLWVDVGAESAEEVAALGIELLDPIVRHLPPWTLEGAVAGPSAGDRVSCAVVAALAQAARNADVPPGETHFVLAAQSGMGRAGLQSYLTRNAPFDTVAFVLPVGSGRGGSLRMSAEEWAEMDAATGETLQRWGSPGLVAVGVAARYAGSHMEVAELEHAERTLAAGARAIGMEIGEGTSWVHTPRRAALRDGHADASLDSVAGVLEDLVELHSVSGHEWAVRRYVLEALPEWARDAAVVDGIGNVWVAAGPDRDTTVFMAHMDEVGYEIAAIDPDGTVTLERAGGPVSSAWEGQTALVHIDPEDSPNPGTGDATSIDPVFKRRSLSATAPPPLRGIFVTRERATERHPDTLRAFFGLDAAELEAAGVRAGSPVTSHKEGIRLGRHRFVARALDDRAGTTALLLAIRRLDPDALDHKVIFAWSVNEEGGLVGAEAMAKRFGATTRRIYSVDTFVSSDTPLESPHFAHAPLGDGPVLRAIENSSVSPDAERDRVRRIAREAGIPLQTGLTQGGTDGTEFTYLGAPNQGLSWPGRYSHSPGEVLDLRDLARLSELIVAVATAAEDAGRRM